MLALLDLDGTLVDRDAGFDRLGLSSAPCWVVGDDPELDVAGGRSSGLRTIWVSHGRSWPAGDLPPDQTAETPAAALALLGTMA